MTSRQEGSWVSAWHWRKWVPGMTAPQMERQGCGRRGWRWAGPVALRIFDDSQRWPRTLCGGEGTSIETWDLENSESALEKRAYTSSERLPPLKKGSSVPGLSIKLFSETKLSLPKGAQCGWPCLFIAGRINFREGGIKKNTRLSSVISCCRELEMQ